MAPYDAICRVVTTRYCRCVVGSCCPPNAEPNTSSMTTGTAKVKTIARMFRSWRFVSRYT